MSLWTAVIGTAIAAVGLLYTVIKLNNMRNSPYQTRTRAERRSSSAEDSNIVLCETCNMPQMGDATTWRRFECGHCYHQQCLNLFASKHCITCEFVAAEQVAASRQMGNS
uniref:RING-type domain-containing protein n=1 Tax=Anopheles minimus TaxID=112268 RepID=A0A182VQ34_9DIPT